MARPRKRVRLESGLKLDLKGKMLVARLRWISPFRHRAYFLIILSPLRREPGSSRKVSRSCSCLPPADGRLRLLGFDVET